MSAAKSKMGIAVVASVVLSVITVASAAGPVGGAGGFGVMKTQPVAAAKIVGK